MQEPLRFRFQLQFSFYFFSKCHAGAPGRWQLIEIRWVDAAGGFSSSQKNKETCKTPVVAHRQTPRPPLLRGAAGKVAAQLQLSLFYFEFFFVTLPFSFSPRGHRLWQLPSDSDTHKTALNNGQSHVLLFFRKRNNNKKEQVIM